MSDERFKQIMEQLGMPRSASLKAALEQVANEAAQEQIKKYDVLLKCAQGEIEELNARIKFLKTALSAYCSGR